MLRHRSLLTGLLCTLLTVGLAGTIVYLVKTTVPAAVPTAAAPSAAPPPTATKAPEPIVVPADLAGYIRAATSTCPQVPPQVLAGQLWVESNFDPKAKSPAGAKGIAQFIKDTWAEYGVDGNNDGKVSIYDPADAVPAAAAYDCNLLRMVKDVPGDPVTNMLAAYNAGPKTVRDYHGVPPFPETQAYIDRVLMNADRVAWPD